MTMIISYQSAFLPYMRDFQVTQLSCAFSTFSTILGHVDIFSLMSKVLVCLIECPLPKAFLKVDFCCCQSLSIWESEVQNRICEAFQNVV